MQTILKVFLLLLSLQATNLYASDEPQSVLFSQKTQNVPIVFDNLDNPMVFTNTIAMATSFPKEAEKALPANLAHEQLEESLFEIEEPGVLFFIGLILIAFGLSKSFVQRRKKFKTLDID